MSKQYFILRKLPHPSRKLAAQACLDAHEDYVVKISPPTRSLEQNSKLWAMLNEISEQVEWHGRKLDSEDWKHIFTASLKRIDVVPNLEGTGFVVLGMSTSRMTKAELADLITLIESFGAQHGVIFQDEGIQS